MVSRLTPLVNVDLLIANDLGQTLLTWRDDAYYGPGWHVPGGIIRFKERIGDRIKAVAIGELGAQVSYDPQPIAMNEIMSQRRDTRGHFISFLYRCRLHSEPDQTMQTGTGRPKHGEWAWHDVCPADLIDVHEIYRAFIGRARA